MDLERKVQHLEQEVEILKQQVQETPLGIQEQLLMRSHPGLRSDDTPPSDERPTQPYRPPLEERLPKQPSQPSPPAPQAPPKVEQKRPEKRSKVVSLQALTGVAPAPTPQGIDWAELDRLEAWALHKMKAMGIARTRKLIRMHMSKGRINEEIAAALLQFVALYENQKQRPAQEQAAPSPKVAEPKSDDKHHNLILRLIAGVSNAGISRKERYG